jgi:hypothetical protein
MKVIEIFESKTNFSPAHKKNLERMNRKRFAQIDAAGPDSKPGGSSDVMKQLTPKNKDARSKSNLKRGKTGVSGKERLRKIKKVVPGEM